ncbi:MAG: PAS domain S-box protein [Syntrophaceae bacterium]|nr:PAS domain S-box protein [Syntrophaceae bacterium]
MFLEHRKESRFVSFLVKLGSSSQLDPEERRRRLLAVLLLLIMMAATLAFSVYHFYSRHYAIVAWDGLGFFLSLLILLYFRKNKKTDIGYWMAGCGLILFCSVTTVIGRTETSVFFWAFVFPIVSFIMMGDKKGLLFTVLFFCINVFLMTAPEQMMLSKPYSSSFVIRFNVIYILTTIAIYHYETSHKIMVTDIQQQEDKYRSILENMQEGYFEVDLAGNYTFFNDSLCRIHDYPREELMGMNFRHFTDKKTSDNVIQVYDRVYQTKNPLSEIYWQITTKNGNKRYVEAFVSLLQDSSGKPIGFRGILRDITERKRMTEELIKSEDEYRLLADNITENVWLMDLNSQKIIYISPSVEKMYGYTIDEFKNLSLKEILTAKSFQKMIDTFITEMHKASETAPPFIHKYSLELQARHKDGRLMWLDNTVSFIRDENGNLTLMLGETRDITERKQAEEKLQKTLESLRKSIGTTIQVLVSASESRDPYTAGHQLRATNLACAIAIEMGLPQDKIEGIQMAGLIHDIGKLAVPTEILSKPTKLTNVEFTLIKEHSHNGYEMLKGVESPWPLAEIVHQHHERMDGSGYPRNLKGDEILLEARIMAVADVVEAMASHRPYRPALSIETAPVAS